VVRKIGQVSQPFACGQACWRGRPQNPLLVWDDCHLDSAALVPEEGDAELPRRTAALPVVPANFTAVVL